jgi:hypothetical protein
MDLPDPLTEGAYGASGGIYYTARMPGGWELFSFRFDEYGADILHPWVWEDYVVPILASKWNTARRGVVLPLPHGTRVKRDDSGLADLEEKLLELNAAFPRGRIMPRGTGYVHLHGNDLSGMTGFSLERAERPFVVVGQVAREFDPHEQCLITDRDAIRRVLGIEETWPAVDGI